MYTFLLFNVESKFSWSVDNCLVGFPIDPNLTHAFLHASEWIFINTWSKVPYIFLQRFYYMFTPITLCSVIKEVVLCYG